MADVVPVEPRVLEWARTSALASIAEAAERTGRDPQTIRDWEDGTSFPTFSQLEHLAEEYGVSVNVLLLPQPPPTPEPPPDFRSPSDGREPISRITRREVRRARHLQALLSEVIVLPPPAIPEIRQGADAASAIREALAVPIADQLRWRDSNHALREWRAALNRLGILVLQYGLPREELQGLSLPAASAGPPVVLLNQGDAVNARNFTMIHELAHLTLANEGAICDPWRHGARLTANSLEARCNRIAGAVLVPGGHLREQGEATLIAAESDDQERIRLLRALGNRYKVSGQVIWYRVRDLGLVSDATFHELWPKLRRAPKVNHPTTADEERSGIPRWSRARSRFGPELLSGLLGAVERGTIEPTRVMRALHLGSGDLARLQGEPGGS